MLGLARSVGIIAVIVVTAVVVRQLGFDSIPTVLLASIVAFGAITVTRPKRARHRQRAVRFGTTGLGVALLVGLAASTWSYVGYQTAPGSATTAVRTSDWMRDHHMNAIVDRLEQTLFSGPAPADGRVAAGQLPSLSITHRTSPGHSDSTGSALMPAPVADLIDHHLQGEGHWTPSTRRANGRPVDYATFVRPDPTHTNVVASAVWFDPQGTRITYVPGTKQKGTWAWGSGIPTAKRPDLVAAFNSGFKFKDIPGGYQTEGRTPVPLVDGQASLVLHAHGPADIGSWGSEVKMTSDVISVRQNLALLVDHGKQDPGLASTEKGLWGKRRWQNQYTNRSGIGVTSDHALVYVAGSNLTTRSLADAFVKLGCVRAMELDIHATNPTLNFFSLTPGGGRGDVTGTKLYPAMTSSADRFLVPDQRDFFAVTVPGPGRG
ncbi:MAG: phosphodiester glycosidase family protein [Mycobacteriaceae bacterium]